MFCLPKGGKERDIPLPDTVCATLQEHMREHPPVTVTLPWKTPAGKPETAQLLFTGRTGHAVTQNSWNASAWRPALQAAGIEPGRDAGFHQLRHHYASRLLADGVDIKALSEALGHHAASFTLDVYAHMMPTASDRIRAAIDGKPATAHGTDMAQEA